MNAILRVATCLLICFVTTASLLAADRADELKQEMWGSSDKDFKVVAVPDKWKDRSAVIIARLNRFEYRKQAMAALLNINQYNHYRVKLNDKNAVNEYAEISFKSGDKGRVRVYVGFKVIKPNGREIIVDPATAVKMERRGSDGYAYKKIAIPNLEPGDILDYYLCEEEERIITSLIEFFDPIIHNLRQEYPVMKQKLQFKVQRRCYINLRSINGAPELKLVTDEEKDEQYYSLEDGDRDGIADMKWLYPNRDVPTVKFRAAYASNKGVNSYDVLLDEQGVVKNKVTADELAEVSNTMMKMVLYAGNTANKYLKKNYNGPTDNFSVARAGYYYNRHELLNQSETLTLQNKDLPSEREMTFIASFSNFLKEEDIPHDIVVAVARRISSIDDVIFESELDYLIRVRQGKEFLYFSPYSIYTVPGAIPSALQGADAYAFDGLTKSTRWVPQRTTLPALTKDDNVSATSMTVKLSTDLQKATLNVQRNIRGVEKPYHQYRLLDVYDAIDEDNKAYAPYEYVYPHKAKKEYTALQQAYQQNRSKSKTDALKDMIADDYEFKADDPTDLKITQTGRSDKDPAMVYSFTFGTDELVKKTGPNYLVDIGKLIEGQVSIRADEMDRDQNIYFDNARSFRYTVTLDIPAGYQVQGLDKLNSRVENAVGGFTSTAKEENGKLVIETYKHYGVTFASKSEWPNVVAFVNAAHTFTGQKILLKKK
ncbi:DUF3857 domain-containing protein [Dawidia soli]|uniref:DUF3857 domain-containing protein n=1 Tax=Dawidia soli TaxID=2782352 RepID=A0AAP2DCG1_9BACT|nr:DUF3857 domain-containing protein [Dawidia soli]MBT1689214.1 DUF3857 domain-containing protein [Dawidia soli]